jgi:hypothetical protein
MGGWGDGQNLNNTKLRETPWLNKSYFNRKIIGIIESRELFSEGFQL